MDLWLARQDPQAAARPVGSPTHSFQQSQKTWDSLIRRFFYDTGCLPSRRTRSTFLAFAIDPRQIPEKPHSFYNYARDH